MDSIFEDAHLVISAVDCSDSSQRILLHRANNLRSRKLLYTNTTGKEFKLYVRKYHDHHPDFQENTPTSPSGPLTTRGWAQQEHILATWILHYTATELVFECKSAVLCECRPRAIMPPSDRSLLAQTSQPASSTAVITTEGILQMASVAQSLFITQPKLPLRQTTRHLGYCREIQDSGGERIHGWVVV